MIAALERQMALLRKEFEWERDDFKCETTPTGLRRRVERGVCWDYVTVGRTYYNAHGYPVVELSRQLSLDVQHQFEYGKPVRFFYREPSASIGGERLVYLPAACSVVFADEEHMAVQLPSMDVVRQLDGRHGIGVQMFFDELSFRLMFEALAEVMAAKTGRLAELRDVFHGSAPCRWLQLPHVGMPWLNPTQETAVNKILCAKDVAVVHGPPGTGKTTTLVEAIDEVLRREAQVLVCAQSNMAVDHICSLLDDRGIAVLRIGNPSRVTDRMLACTYDRRFESHPDYPELWAARRTVRQLQKSRPSNLHQKLSRLRDRIAELELRIRNDVFGGVRVVASTLVGAGSPLLYGAHFHTLFIDEAAQALEAACWIAIRKATRVVFAGDHLQLPPTIKCLEAERGGLGRSLMEQVVAHRPGCVTLLGVQYRMVEPLMRFPSRYFYQGQVATAQKLWPASVFDHLRPLTWIDTSEVEAPECFVSESAGRYNPTEARLTVDALERFLVDTGLHHVRDERIDIGIISPYRAQVQLLRRLIRQMLKHLELPEGLRRADLAARISVDTVDGFQGQERDVVMLSLVRSNDEGRVGFLADMRRMNVAITRARRKLIILGNATTLGRLPFYRELYEYVVSCEFDN